MIATLVISTAATYPTKGPRRNAIDAAVQNSAGQFSQLVKDNMAASVPAGRTYRRGPIVRPLTRKNSSLKLTARGRGVIVGSKFHRASARGQAPAIDTGGLLNSIVPSRIAEFRARVNVGKQYGRPLDDPAGLDRPFFYSQAELFRPTFYENIRKAAFD